MLTVSDDFRKVYPEARLGLLVMREVANPPAHRELEQQKRSLEEELRGRFTGLQRGDLKNMEPFTHYAAFYKKFKKSYHVLLQLESVAFKGKAIPRVAALVEAMFMAELKNRLLTAGHDLVRIRLPLVLHVAAGGEKMVQPGGQEKELYPGDMYVADGEGILSSVIYGPAARGLLAPETKNAVFVVYAPPGIGGEAVLSHLTDLETYVRIVAPEGKTVHLQVY